MILESTGDESPVQMVVAAVEEVARTARVAPRTIWRNVAKLAQSMSVHRKEIWV